MENTTLPLVDRLQRAISAYESGNLAIPISAILLGQPDQGQAQVFIIGL